MKLCPSSHHIQQIKSRWTKDLNIKGKTGEILEDNIQNNFKLLRAEKIDKPGTSGSHL
jgi:hypothetical protein